uniref:Uncharacterized protein n=1 Tax=Oreochromis niloticus TaxID=8128 RepID=A0A669DZE1_ORENI
MYVLLNNGLRSLGVLDALQTYPLQMKCLFEKNLITILYFSLIVENDVSLEDILVFCTGCDSIPALVANTCENILRIPPAIHGFCQCFDLFTINIACSSNHSLPDTVQRGVLFSLLVNLTFDDGPQVLNGVQIR